MSASLARSVRVISVVLPLLATTFCAGAASQGAPAGSLRATLYVPAGTSTVNVPSSTGAPFWIAGSLALTAWAHPSTSVTGVSSSSTSRPAIVASVAVRTKLTPGTTPPTATPEPSLPAIYADPPPAPGWVPMAILLVESGCYGTECGSQWTPQAQEYLFELKADRIHRGQGEGDSSPPFPLLVSDPRARCMGQWAAGNWYHNAVWTTFWTQEWTRWGTRWVEHWNGSPNWEGWNFAEDNRCPQATPSRNAYEFRSKPAMPGYQGDDHAAHVQGVV